MKVYNLFPGDEYHMKGVRDGEGMENVSAKGNESCVCG